MDKADDLQASRVHSLYLKWRSQKPSKAARSLLAQHSHIASHMASHMASHDGHLTFHYYLTSIDIRMRSHTVAAVDSAEVARLVPPYGQGFL